MHELIGTALTRGVWILEVILGFGLIIFVHELGHFLVAKKFNVLVEKFSLGFGPRLLGFQWGETEYRVSWIPLGGYVKLSGEQSARDKEPDPRDLVAQPVGVRAAIFAAGSVMNLLFTFPLLWAMYMAGVMVPGPLVGEVRQGSPVAEAGLRPGDSFVAVAGEDIAVWEDVRRVFQAHKGDTVPAVVARPGAGRVELALPVPADGLPQFLDVRRDALGSVPENSVAARAGVKEGDEVLAIGARTFSASGPPAEWYGNFSEVWDLPPTQPVRVRVRRDGVEKQFDIAEPELDGTWTIGVRLFVPAVAGEIVAGFPAEKSGLKTGDRIAAIDGIPVRDWSHMAGLVQTAAAAIDIQAVRGEEELHFSLKPKRSLAGLGAKQMGVGAGHPQVYAVVPGSPAAEKGIRAGDFIVSVGGSDVVSERALHEVLEAHAAGDVAVEILRDGETRTVLVAPQLRPHAGLGINYRMAYLQLVPYRLGPVRAFVRAGLKFGELFVHTGLILKGLFSGLISAKHVSGPLGIVGFSYKQASEGVGHLLGFLAMISLNLSVVNMFPIPILDGGHLLLLVVEKLKGRPLSDRSMAVAQYVGLAIVLLVFILATRNDIGLLSTLFGR